MYVNDPNTSTYLVAAPALSFSSPADLYNIQSLHIGENLMSFTAAQGEQAYILLGMGNNNTAPVPDNPQYLHFSSIALWSRDCNADASFMICSGSVTYAHTYISNSGDWTALEPGIATLTPTVSGFWNV